MTEGGFWSLCDRCFLWPYTFNLALISDKTLQITQDGPMWDVFLWVYKLDAYRGAALCVPSIYSLHRRLADELPWYDESTGNRIDSDSAGGIWIDTHHAHFPINYFFVKFMSFHASIRILRPPSFDFFARSLTVFLTMAAGEYTKLRFGVC